MDEITRSEIESRYQSHQIVQVQKVAIDKVRQAAIGFALAIEETRDIGADPRYIALAGTSVEQAAMWATKAITHGE